jgi:hypothetical protein
MKDNLKF